MVKLLSIWLVSFICLTTFFILPAHSQEPRNILSIEAYDMLNSLPGTYLIDVRTRAEYQFTGHPEAAHLFPYFFFSGKLEKNKDGWEYQFSDKNKSFLKEISEKFQKDNNLLIISRDGTRSMLAAKELVRNGFIHIYNIKDGFEGASFPCFEDEIKHKFYRQLAKRNKISTLNHRHFYGWQWWGLPWTYEIDIKYIYPPDKSINEDK